jgi:hypothetical protein
MIRPPGPPVAAARNGFDLARSQRTSLKPDRPQTLDDVAAIAPTSAARHGGGACPSAR